MRGRERGREPAQDRDQDRGRKLAPLAVLRTLRRRSRSRRAAGAKSLMIGRADISFGQRAQELGKDAIWVFVHGIGPRVREKIVSAGRVERKK